MAELVDAARQRVQGVADVVRRRLRREGDGARKSAHTIRSQHRGIHAKRNQRRFEESLSLEELRLIECRTGSFDASGRESQKQIV
jgi:hypothetical protein